MGKNLTKPYGSMKTRNFDRTFQYDVFYCLSTSKRRWQLSSKFPVENRLQIGSPHNAYLLHDLPKAVCTLQEL